ncbi:beta-lactamase family protein [Pyxidicoccus fallax]|uniref:Beta-lactamase family protein n=1 Tax=Pyxidicoccus fallax TaxID=394095 RepID=A0A848LCR4_9BACT|nr:serine hydrolase domain-containing protein [Pyxidicoccus fallax]NMO16022.1 beta-lactamase family protein [Pyxidicoccus fallax]NPC76965.1 beta-lactamase family protein [Pyxidicoccus fallax]
MHSVLATLLVAASLGLAPASPEATPTQSLPARLDSVIDRALAEKRIVGTVVLVARDGKVIYRRAAGFADREAKRPMREDTLFRLASLSKTPVSAAALALIEQKKLGLEDPVTKWIPTFRPKLPDGSEPVITVRQLLTHTAGLTYDFLEPKDGPYHRARVSTGLDQPGLSMQENLRRLGSVPLTYAPGRRWGYSMATDVLGEVVARAGGAPLPKVVERLVTRPLGLSETGFTVKDAARLATPYADGKPEPVRMGESHFIPNEPGGTTFAPGRVFDTRSFPSGGAGMVGTAGDFLKFLEALRTGGAPVLSTSMVEQMMRDQVGPQAESMGPGWGFGFGAGVLVDPAKAKSPQSPGTFEWMGAYGHHWFVDPKQRLTVVALTNTTFEGMWGAFPYAIRDAVYAADR